MLLFYFLFLLFYHTFTTVDKYSEISVCRYKKKLYLQLICFKQPLKYLYLNSAVLPHITPFTIEEEANRGDSVQLNCHVSKGDLPFKFSWTLNGLSVDKYTDISVGRFGKKTSSLNIESVDEHHAGNYTCFVMNKAGTTSHTAELVVKGT